MNGHSLGAAVRRLRDALGGAAGSDAALLDRFAANRDPAAFAGLVARYGPLVLGVCRRAVGDPHLAEDVFQAVFLVLARKAGTIRKWDALGSWLYGVAYRLGRKVRTRIRFAPADTMRARNAREPDDPAGTAAWNDLLAALDHELHRLPDRLRAPLLLCYYDGCTQDEAAARLGWSLGTLRRRLVQGRDLLRTRLTARGATLGAGLLATVLATRGATAAVPARLARATIDGAATLTAGGRLTGPVGELAEEGLRMAGTSKPRAIAALVLLFGGLAAGTGALFGVGRDEPPLKDSPPAVKADPSLPAGAVLRHGDPAFRHGDEILNVLATPDGTTVLTQGRRTVRLWDVATGRNQGGLELPDGGSDFWTASLTPDGKTLLTTRHNGTAQVWDLAGRKLLRSFRLAAPPFDVTGAKCVHSPDGRAIAVVTADGSIRVCDVAAGKEMDQLRSHSDYVTAAVFTRDGKRLVLACGQGSGVLRVWDVATGVEDQTEQRGFQEPELGNLAFAPDGTRLAAAHAKLAGRGRAEQGGFARGGSVAAAFISVLDWRMPGNNWREFGGDSLADQLLVFTPDGRYLLAPDRRSQGRILTQWDVTTGRAMRQYPEHDGPIRALTFTADGHTLITADTALRFWDWTTGREARRAADRGDRCYALTADGKAVVEGDRSGTVRLWDSATGAELRRVALPQAAADMPVRAGRVAVSPDGSTLAVQGSVSIDWLGGPAERWSVWVVDVATGKLAHQLHYPPQTEARGISFSPDGRMLVSAAGNRVFLWNLATGQETTDRLSQGRTAQAAFSATLKAVVVWDGHGTVRVDPLTSVPAFKFPVQSGGPVPGWDSFVLAPDGSRLAVSASGNDAPGDVWVYRMTTGKVAGHVTNLAGPPSRLALSKDEAMLAIALAGENPPVLVFDVESGRELKRFTGLHGRAAWLAFAPDGRRLYSASTDTTVLAWDTADVRPAP